MIRRRRPRRPAASLAKVSRAPSSPRRAEPGGALGVLRLAPEGPARNLAGGGHGAAVPARRSPAPRAVHDGPRLSARVAGPPWTGGPGPSPSGPPCPVRAVHRARVDPPTAGRHVASQAGRPAPPAAFAESPRAYSKLTRNPVLSKVFKFMPLVFAV